MDFEIRRKSEKELELIFDEASTTFVDPLATYILEVDKRAFATYVLDHPIKGPLRLVVRAERGDPVDLVFKAIERLQKEIEEIREHIEKEANKT